MRTRRPAALDEVTGIEPDEFEGVATGGAHDREVAAVNRRDTRHVVAFGDRDQARIGDPKTKIGVCPHELIDAVPIGLVQRLDLEAAVSDHRNQRQLGNHTQTTGEHVASLCDHQRRRDQRAGVAFQEFTATEMILIVAVSESDKRTGIDEEHYRSVATEAVRQHLVTFELAPLL